MSTKPVNPELFDNDTAAAYIGAAPTTLPVWRCTKRVPLPYIKVGRKVLYRKRDLDAFLEQNLVGGRKRRG